MHPRDIFDITGVYPMKGGGYISLGEVSSFCVHFPILKRTISKIILVCGVLIFNIYIFRIKIHPGLQVDIDFNTE